MPFRATFDCLWCGAPYETRGPDDLEGWAQICSTCLGKAGDNGFLRFRLRAAMNERAAARSGSVAVAAAPAISGTPLAAAAAQDVAAQATRRSATDRTDPTMVAYYQARAGEYDDWYLRRGRYDHGPIANVAWQADLDTAGRWLDDLPWGGEIVELAAGTGWWSPLLASKGELSLYDAAEAPLDRARDRLLAHGLRAHLHVRDAWSEPDRAVDGLFTGFWLSHVERPDLDAFLELVRRWLRPGGLFAFIDSRPDPQSGAADQTSADDRSVRRLADGREFTIPKIYREPAELEAALRDAGFADAAVTATDRFFVLGRATA